MDRLIAAHTVPFGSHDVAPSSGATPAMATDGNPALGIPPTTWPAYGWNMLEEEIRNVVIDAGISPNSSDWTQLRQAIRAIAGAVSGGPYVHQGGVTGMDADSVQIGWNEAAAKLKAAVNGVVTGNFALEAWVTAAVAAEATLRSGADAGLTPISAFISSTNPGGTYFRMPNNGFLGSGGVLIQSGSAVLPTGNNDGVPFPVAFPNAVFGVTANDINPTAYPIACILPSVSSLSGFLAFARNTSGATASTSIRFTAWGY